MAGAATAASLLPHRVQKTLRGVLDVVHLLPLGMQAGSHKMASAGNSGKVLAAQNADGPDVYAGRGSLYPFSPFFTSRSADLHFSAPETCVLRCFHVFICAV